MDGLHKSVYGTQPSQPLTGPHINELIARTKAEQENKDQCRDKCRVVCLPSQRHYYYMPLELTASESTGPVKLPVCGARLPKVTFLHPGHLFQIIPLLRKQLVYNTLLGSCFGRSTKNVAPDPSTSEYIFTLTTSPPEVISVTMDTLTTQEETKITFEFVIPIEQPAQPQVKVGLTSSHQNVHRRQLSEILRRCLSIPVTLEAALNHPASFLDSAIVATIQKYKRELAQFSSEVAVGAAASQSSLKSRGAGEGRAGEGRGGEGASPAHLVAGMKRKWTD